MPENLSDNAHPNLSPILFRPKVGLGDIYACNPIGQNNSSLLPDGAKGTIEQLFDALNHPCMPVREICSFAEEPNT